MLSGIARLAIAAPRRVIALALLAMVATAVFGIPVTKSLSAGGFADPGSESSRAERVLASKFGQGDMEMVIAVSSPEGAQSPAVRRVGTDIIHQLQGRPGVAKVTAPWNEPPAVASELISKDGKTGLIIVGINGNENEGQQHAKALADEVVHDRDGVTVKAGGEAMMYAQINAQSEHDLRVMELIAIPLSFVVLVWIFGGLLAAALPMMIGCLAILGSLAVLRAVTYFTDVSIFALNLTTAMGLALAIDYTLLIVSRYREEIEDGGPREEALLRTMEAAGRTVLFSALTVALSMATMVLFPMYFLRSFAYAAVAVVAFAATAAILVAPAAIVLLGDRLNAYDVRRMGRRLLRRPEPTPKSVEQMLFYRSTKFVMRHALVIGLAIIFLLLALGYPFLGVKWGFPDDRVLPQNLSSRQVGDDLRGEFPSDPAKNVIAVIPDMIGVPPNDLDEFAALMSSIPGVTSVSAPSGTFVNGMVVGPPSAPTGLKNDSAFMTIGSTARLFSDESHTQLDRMHAIPGPGDAEVLFTGTAQENRDGTSAVTSRLPLVLSVIAIITFVLLFLLTGSVLMPIKALVLNVLSLTAAFGALVWIFQEGHLNGLGTTPNGTLVVTIPVLLFCISFGLAMDYEVFLVSRIREYWLESGQTRADNDESVALGLARSGRVVTAAAVVMSISFAALIAAKVSFMRMFGLGLTLAIAVDATLVRMMLLPAFMRMAGHANWWAPKPLAKLHDRFGISEAPAVEKTHSKTGGRTAGPDRDTE